MKKQMKYHVVSALDPNTRAKNGILRPVVVGREAYDLDALVNFAIENDYVNGGKFHCMRGVLRGFIEAIQTLIRDGKTLSIDGLARFHGELTGTVGPDHKLTPANQYRIVSSPLKGCKCDVADFDFKEEKNG